MKYLIPLLAFLFCLFFNGTSQDISLNNNAATRAVVIGISDYQDKKIDDLNFAHKDAEAFADFLFSKAGGSLTEDQLVLLTNEQATEARIYMALDWLVETTQQGDIAVIYFSGHGDAEVKLRNQPAFLLTYNSVGEIPKVSSVRLNDLENYISTLSLDNKGKVLVVTDTCRSGSLVGREGGAKMANNDLAKQFANEIKILSCQPDEYSVEGEEWGGGHGAFTWNLIDGLYGNADGDKDLKIELREIDRYLEDHVTPQVAPIRQVPMTVGNKTERISIVDEDLLAQWRINKTNEFPSLKPIDQKGLVEKTLAKVDTSIRELYYVFVAAVGNKIFLEPADSCADAYYKRLMAVPELKPLYGMMTRNFAAALMDDAQEWLNKLLQSTLFMSEWRHPKGYDRYFARAAELLGEGHYLYGSLKGKEYFFRARDLRKSDLLDSLYYDQSEHYLRQGLAYDGKAPYLYFSLAYNDNNDLLEDIGFLKKAIELAPSWAWAHFLVGNKYAELGKFKMAREWFEKTKALDVEMRNPLIADVFYDVYLINHQFEEIKKMGREIVEAMESGKRYVNSLEIKANIYWWYGYLDKAEITFKEHIRQVLASGDEQLIRSLGLAYGQLGCVKLVQGDWEEAEKWWLKQDSLDGIAASSSGWRCWIQFTRGQSEEASRVLDEYMSNHRGSPIYSLITDVLFVAAIYDQYDYSIFYLEKSREYYPDHAPLHYHLARLYIEQKNDYGKGVPLLERAVQLDPDFAYAHYHLAVAYAHLGKQKAALDYLEKALEKGYDDPEKIQTEPVFDDLRNTRRYKKQMQRSNQ